jgi:sortase (surface protein transpeptidase)
MNQNISHALWVIIRIFGLLCIVFALPKAGKLFTYSNYYQIYSEYTHISSKAVEGSPHFDSPENRKRMSYRTEAVTQLSVAGIHLAVLIGLGIYCLAGGRRLHRLLSPPSSELDSNQSEQDNPITRP